ncbi:MAG: thiamine phosphate synthase [Sphingobium sp.]
MAAFHRKSSRAQNGRPLPRLWLFTDERVSTQTLLASVARLPRGSGIIFRHYATTRDKRRKIFDAVRKIALRRGLTLVVARPGDTRLLREADGIHRSGKDPCPSRITRSRLLTMSAHNAREIHRANRIGADLIFLSPAFPTRSHKDAAALGAVRFATLARLAAMPVIALGGMNIGRFRRLRFNGAYGWAAIDALTASHS